MSVAKPREKEVIDISFLTNEARELQESFKRSAKLGGCNFFFKSSEKETLVDSTKVVPNSSKNISLSFCQVQGIGNCAWLISQSACHLISVSSCSYLFTVERMKVSI